MKIGGVRGVIPANKAYGEQKLGWNSPLKFMVMAIEKPADVTKMPEVMKQYYPIARF